MIWLVASKTVTVFANIFDSEQRKEVSGVVGVSDVANQEIISAPNGILSPRHSQSLAWTDQPLPLPSLDGGHIFWSLVEKVRGKAVRTG